MKSDEVTSLILGCSVSGFYKWKKQKRPVIHLLEKYFTKEELEEFLQTNEISKFENIICYENILNLQFITFLEKGYLNKNELKEFLDTKKIEKFELIKNLTSEELKIIISKHTKE